MILGIYKDIIIVYNQQALCGVPEYVSFSSKGKLFKPTGFSINDFHSISVPNVLNEIPHWAEKLTRVRVAEVFDIIEEVGKIEGPYADIAIYKKIIDFMKNEKISPREK